MTDIGARPKLEELLGILHGIVRIEADWRATQEDQKQFSVTLTFEREKLAAMGGLGWVRDGLPKPTWLFEGILEELQAWLRQRIREASWVNAEAQYGAGIASLIDFMTYQMKECMRAASANPRNMQAVMNARLYSNAVGRLQELQERRTAGGVHDEVSFRREQARRTWADDEFEAPKREEEQRQQRERQDGYTRERFEEYLGRRKPSNSKPWYVVLDVPETATREEITKAYRRMAQRYHPDRYKDTDRDTRMAEINVARDTALTERGL